MSLLAHVTPVETTTFVLVFAIGVLCGLAVGCGIGWLVAQRAKERN
jgi:NhaP-type Na+/H+ or K+/H+ antiporter